MAKDLAWYEDPDIKNIFIKAASNAMRGYHCPLTSPKTTFTGTNSLIDFINHVGAYLAPEERRALIVVDKDLRKYATMVADKLRQLKGIESHVFDHVLPDVPKDTVMEGVEACRAFDPKLLIAIGGGSAIDTAKCILLLYEKPDLDLRGIMAPAYVGLRKKVLALAAMPTTSGTGAETTFIAVITDTDRDPPKKIELVLYELCPDFAVLYPEFVRSMPPYLTIGTGIDALCHAMGSSVLSMSNVFTDMCMHQAIRLIREYLPRTVARGDDMEAREKMQLAAYIAGLGFGNVSGGLEHAMGHAFGSVFHVHHGVCVGLFLGASLAYQAKVTNRFLPLADLWGVDRAGKSREQALRELLTRVFAFYDAVGCPRAVKDLARPSVSRAEYESRLDQLEDFAFNDYCTLSSTRAVNARQYRHLFEIAYENDLDALVALSRETPVNSQEGRA